jgi:hypothetical protein
MSFMKKSLAAAILVSASMLLPGVATAQNYPDSVKQMVGGHQEAGQDDQHGAVQGAVDKKEAGTIIDVRRKTSTPTATCRAPSTCRAA